MEISNIRPGLVSVVIPCFNAKPYIKATIESALAQRPVNVEIIVVDDGSTDGSADLVASQFPGISLYRTANQGPSSARKYGTQRSAGEFIQYLDADDLLAPGKLQTQLAALCQSDADVAYGDWIKFQAMPDGTKVVLERIERRLGPSPDIDLLTGFWCPLAAYLIRRPLVERVGWHPNLPIIQDARFMQDCALHGARFVYCAAPMAEYRVHQRDSVSTRSRVAFISDCLESALEIRDWWVSRGQLDRDRRQAVAGALDMVATASVAMDRDLFDRACRAIASLEGDYPAAWPARKRTGIALLGYRSYTTAAHRFRQCKSTVGRRIGYRHA